MLGQQSSFLRTSASSSLLNSSSLGLITQSPVTSTTTGANSNLQSTGIDDKSIKDIIQILNKCIDKTKNLTEFSQILQIENIGSSFKNHLAPLTL